MRPLRLTLVPLLLCMLSASCRPFESAPGLALAAPGNSAELAGSRGKRKPGTRPVNKSRCLDSAAAGGVVWNSFCASIKDASTRKRCFAVSLESEQRKTGFCNNFF